MLKPFRSSLVNRPFLAAWLILAAILAARAAGQSDTPLLAETDLIGGLVVLQNGHVLEGRVTKAGDFYRVAIEGGEIRLRSAEVDFVCRDIEEAYQRKRTQLVRGTAEEHANLARWLQRHGLLEQAAQELALASELDPRHPMIPLLKRRLETALAPPQSSAAGRRPETVGPSVSSDELDRMTRELPRSTVATFTRTIQPLLSNRCATANCHGPGSENGFSFRRLSYGRSPTRRTTQRNLRATLEWVDRSHPADSKLLTVPAGAHGEGGPVFANHDAQLARQLTAWVWRLAYVDASPYSAVFGRGPVPSQATGTVQALHTSSSAAAPSEKGSSVEPAGYSADVVQPNSQPPHSLPRASQADFPTPFGPPDTPALQRGGGILGFVPVDPFDPAIFNRRFHGQKPAQ